MKRTASTDRLQYADTATPATEEAHQVACICQYHALGKEEAYILGIY